MFDAHVSIVCNQYKYVRRVKFTKKVFICGQGSTVIVPEATPIMEPG